MKNGRTQWLWLLGIAVFSILLLLCITGFSSEMFLYDDNRNQWMPIMDKAYEQFFSTGIMPNYDFFQSKGLEIADEGYYGLNNPLMLLSYIVYRFVFWKSWGATISFYIILMVVLGNSMAFLVGRELGLSEYKSVLLVLMYTSCAAFYLFAQWYYIFNNYFIVPLILYTVLRLKESRWSYIACGVILAFSLLMGNVQYTIYQYCLYALIMLGMALFGKRSNFLKMLTNCLTGLLLSVPQLVTLMQSSQRSTIYNGVSSSTLSGVIASRNLLWKMCLPFGLLSNDNPQIFSGKLVGREELQLLYAGGFILCLCGGILWLAVKLWKKIPAFRSLSSSEQLGQIKKCFYRSEEQAFLMGTILAMLFLTSMYTGGAVGRLFTVLPVVRNLRFLFKGYFTFLPLCLVPTAFFLRNIRRYLRTLYTLIGILAVLGFVNNAWIYRDSESLYCGNITARYEEETALLEQEFHATGIDTDNYRICSFINGFDFFDIINKIQRNVPTTVEVFTLGGYDFTECEKSLLQSENLMLGREAMYGNVSDETLFDTADEELVEKAAAIERELTDNSVKYLIIDDREELYGKFSDYISTCMTSVRMKNVFPFMQGVRMIELEGIPALCTDDSGKAVPLGSKMDELHFTAEGSDCYRLAFTYKDRLQAFCGNKQLTVSEDEDGYLLVRTDGIQGTVTVTYTNPWIIVANGCSVIVSLLFVGLLILYRKRRKVSHEA